MDDSWLSAGLHYSDVIMGSMASPIPNLTLDYSTVYSGADQRKYQSSASLAFVRGIHRSPLNSPHKGLVTRKGFPFDNVIMGWDVFLNIICYCLCTPYGAVLLVHRDSRNCMLPEPILPLKGWLLNSLYIYRYIYMIMHLKWKRKYFFQDTTNSHIYIYIPRI